MHPSPESLVVEVLVTTLDRLVLSVAVYSPRACVAMCSPGSSLSRRQLYGAMKAFPSKKWTILITTNGRKTTIIEKLSRISTD